MRQSGWERRLREAVEKHMALPAQYGVSDCYLIADDAVEALTGARMYKGVRYKTEAGAGKQLRKRGFETVEDAFRAKFREIPPSMAQRGDIGVHEHDGQVSGGCFTSQGFLTRGTDRPVFLDYRQVKTAFRVE
jgi:hypothetical protein